MNKSRLLAELLHKSGGTRGLNLYWGANRLTVLAYHRIIDWQTPDFTDYEPVVSASPELFERQMEYVAQNFNVIDLDSLQAYLFNNKPLPKRPLLITFDDGYLDNYQNAYPVLKRYGFPAVIFLISSRMDNPSRLWWDECGYCFRFTQKTSAVLPLIGEQSWTTPDDRRSVREQLMRRLKQMPDEAKQDAVQQILERRMNVYKFAAIGVAILVAALPILPAGYLARMATITDAGESAGGQTEASFRGRNSEATVAVMMFSDYPLLGIGYGNFEANYLRYSSVLGIDGRNEARQAHSLYLEAAAETGVVGVFGFTMMYLLIFRSLWIARKQMIQIGRSDLVPWVTGLALGLLGYLLTSIFLHDDYVRYLRLMIGLALSASALSEGLLRKYNQEKTHKALVASPYEGISITDSSK